MNNRAGFTLVAVLIALLIMGFLYAKQAHMLNPQSGKENPIQRSWDAVCKANKSIIQSAIPMYNMNHEPMKILDLKKLSSQITIPPPPAGCPCSYSFDAAGVVVCKVHH